MIEKHIDLLVKYKSLIMYAVFGALTTLVNLVSYYLLSSAIGIPNVPATIMEIPADRDMYSEISGTRIPK